MQAAASARPKLSKVDEGCGSRETGMVSVSEFMSYSGDRLKFYAKWVILNNSKTTASRKTNNIPLESPINLSPEMKFFFWIFKTSGILEPFLKKFYFRKMGLTCIK